MLGQSFPLCLTKYLNITDWDILGPTLFLIYVANINSVIHNAHIAMIADETSLIISDFSGAALERKYSDVLSQLYNWFA